MTDQDETRFSSTAHVPSSPPFNPRIYALSPRSSEPPTSPPVFSSDDAPEEADITNYESPRLKRKHHGTWWTPDDQTTPAPRKRTKLSREICFDSGFWGVDSDFESDEEALIGSNAYPPVIQETVEEQFQRLTKGMTDGEANLYWRVHEGIEKNKTVYLLDNLNLTDDEIRHLGELNQVIQPPPDPGADVPDERAYRSMVPELYLNLRSNHLVHLTPSIFNLQHLTRLNLRANAIKELPSHIGRLHNLTELDLSFTRITTLPSEILRLVTPHGKLAQLLLVQTPLIKKERDHHLKKRHALHALHYHQTQGIHLDEVVDEEKAFAYMRGTALPSALASPADERSILSFYDCIKALNARIVGYGPPAHHRIHDASFDLEAIRPHLPRPVYLASTAITYYDQVGRLLPGSVACPQSEQDPCHYIVRITADDNLPTSYGAPTTWLEPASRSKTHSLFTLSLNKAHQEVSLSRVEELLGNDVPIQIELNLQRARENIESQFEPLRTCYCCGRKYTIVAAEWIEFWWTRFQHESRHHDNVIPFKVQVCSWGCVPDELAARP